MLPVRIALLLSFLPATALLSAQQPSAPTPAVTATAPPDTAQPVPTIHVTSRLVVLDVVVTDGHGRSIKGLKPSDFTLTEDGVPQKIASFTEHDAAAEAPLAEATPKPLPANTFAVQPPITGDRTRTAIVLGALSFANAPQARYDLQKFMKTVPAGMPIAIFRGDWKGIHLIQDFTTDPKVLQEAANSQRILPPLGFPPRSQMRPPDARGLASYLSTFPGRINLIWISDGGAPIGEISSSFPDVSNFLRDLTGTTNVLRLSRIAVYPIDANGVTVPYADQANFDGSAVLPSMGGSIFGQDPGLLFADIDLADMAASTGGRSFYNTNGYAQAIAEVVETGSHYYTISYAPANSNWNGAIRRIKIEVPRNILQVHESASEKFQDALYEPPRIEYRNAYRARSAPDALSVPPGADPQRRLISYSPKGDPGTGRKIIPIQAAMALGAPTPDDIHFKLTATPSPALERLSPGAELPRGNYLAPQFRQDAYRNVLLHYSIDPEDLRFTASGGVHHHDALEFVAVLYRDDGVIVNSFSGKVPITVDDQNYTRIMSAPLTLDQTIAITIAGNPAPGNFFLRTAVHEIPTDRIGAVEIPTEWIKLPSAQSADNNVAAGHAPSNAPPQ